MNEFRLFLKSLGGLHDACVSRMELDLTAGILRLEIDDIFENFKGLPGYRGSRSGQITLAGITEAAIAVSIGNDPFQIYEFSVTPQGESGGDVRIRFWPGGNISVKCKIAEFPSIAEPRCPE